MKLFYPRAADFCKPLWDGMERLIEAGRFIAPREVLRELEARDDELLTWAKQNRRMFVNPDEEQLALLTELLEKHPDAWDMEKETPEADPFVITLARYQRAGLLKEDCHVLAEEQGKGTIGRKIPHVCNLYKIPCIRLVDMFELEGWKISSSAPST